MSVIGIREIRRGETGCLGEEEEAVQAVGSGAEKKTVQDKYGETKGRGPSAPAPASSSSSHHLCIISSSISGQEEDVEHSC